MPNNWREILEKQKEKLAELRKRVEGAQENPRFVANIRTLCRVSIGRMKKLQEAEKRMQVTYDCLCNQISALQQVSYAEDYPCPPNPALFTKKFAPEKSGVYFVWHGQLVVYVGESENMRQRTIGHEKIQQGEMVTWIEYPAAERFYAENFYIGILKPIRNLPKRFCVDTKVA